MLNRLIPDSWPGLIDVMKGEFPDPPEMVEPAMDIVTGDSNPSESGDIASIPDETTDDDGIIMEVDSEFVPSRTKEAVLEYEPE